MDFKDKVAVITGGAQGIGRCITEEFRKAGEIKVRAVGQRWDLILDSETYRIRKMSGLSRKDFAERYKIPIRTLEKWEQGVSSPPQYVLAMMARILSLEDTLLCVCDGPSEGRG